MKNTKPTNRNLAKFFGVTELTVANYKKGSPEKQRLAEAMRMYFMKTFHPELIK